METSKVCGSGYEVIECVWSKHKIFVFCFISAPVKVVSVKPNRNLLMKFHTQYTSITDELENICQTITSPTLSIRDSDKTGHDMSKAELAAQMERQHLKECEENDYVMLSRLFFNRGSHEETDDNFEVCHFSSHFTVLNRRIDNGKFFFLFFSY